MRLTLFHKGLILLAVPIVALLAVLGLTFRVQREQAEAQGWAGHTKGVIAQAHQVMADVSDAQSGVRGYAATGDPAFLASYEAAVRELPRDLDRLEVLVGDNPGQAERAAGIRSRAADLLAWQGEVVGQFRAGEGERAVGRLRAREGLTWEQAVRRDLAAFLREEERLDRARVEELEQSRARFSRLLVGGTVAAVVLAAGLGLLFWAGISSRFAALAENTRRLAAGQALAPPLAGSDEITQLDRAFRDMAADLTRATDRVRESARQFQDLYDNAPCGYHSVGPDGVVLAMNQTELRWLGYDAADVIGRLRFADVLTPASRAAYQHGFARVREHGSVTDVEVELVRRDGTTFPVVINSTSVRDAEGRYVRSRSTLTDLTERKRAEDEVRRLNAELEERVRERTAELAEANRDLRQKNDENEMFVYSVSHDLRSPLVNLQGFSAELGKGCRALAEVFADPAVPAAAREQGQALLDGRMAKALGFIRAAVTRLSNIIDALLRLSRVGRVEYRWELVDVAGVVRRVLDAMQAVVTAKGAAVTVGELPPAWGDATALEQLFANLVGNALTYLDPARPGRVEVGHRADDPAGNGPAYYVRDNGLGIAADHREKIFQAFQRAHPGVGAGEGIGLAIVARVAERHRGRVWVESRPGEGSTFCVALRATPSDRDNLRNSGVVTWTRATGN